MLLSTISSLRRRLTWNRNRRTSFHDGAEGDEQPLLSAAASDSTIGTSSGFTDLLSIDSLDLNAPITTPEPLSPSDHHRQSRTYSLQLSSRLSLNSGSDSDYIQSPSDTHTSEYCAPCRLARASAGYDMRVARLMDPLYCAGCQTEHPALLLSYSSRKAKLKTCIGHLASYTICPHLSISLEDVKRWTADGQDIKYRCQDATCLFSTA